MEFVPLPLARTYDHELVRRSLLRATGVTGSSLVRSQKS